MNQLKVGVRRTRAATLYVVVGVLLSALLGTISIAYAADLGPFEVGTMKQNPLTTTKAPVQIRDQFDGSGALNDRGLQLNNGDSWSGTNTPDWSQASGWRVNSNAAQRNSGSGASFARTPWLNRSTSVTAEFSTMPTSDNLGSIKYGVAILGSASTADALVAVIFRNGNGSNGRFYLEIGTVSGGTYTTRTSPVAVTSNQSTVPTGTQLRVDWDASGRKATASFSGHQLSYTVPANAPFSMGTYAGLFANGQNSNYRLDNFNAQYPASAPVDPCEVTATPRIADDWGHGFRVEVDVTTECETPVTWLVAVDLSTYPMIAQSIETPWNATLVDWNETTRIAKFKGADWNATVSKSTPRNFGFNASRPPAPPGEADYNAVINNDWGTGYCANVAVSTNSPTPITWHVNIDLSTAPLNGTPTGVSNATYEFSGHTMTASGASHNKEVSASSPTSFSFCAAR